MESPSRILDALQTLKNAGRISPQAKISLRGLSTGIRVDDQWTPLDQLIALVDREESFACHH